MVEFMVIFFYSGPKKLLTLMNSLYVPQNGAVEKYTMHSEKNKLSYSYFDRKKVMAP